MLTAKRPGADWARVMISRKSSSLSHFLSMSSLFIAAIIGMPPPMVKAPILAKIQNIFQSDTMLFLAFFPDFGRFLGVSSTKLQFFRKFLQKSLEVIKKCLPLQSRLRKRRNKVH